MSENIHLELVFKMLKDAKGYIEEGDTVQASGKLYKAAEEALKALSEVYAPDLCEEAERRARWTTTFLFKAVERNKASRGCCLVPPCRWVS